MTKNISTILTLLPKLSAAELAQVKATVAHLSAHDAATSPLYDAVSGVVGFSLPFERFALSRRGKIWVKSEAAFVGFMDAIWPDLTKKIEREVGMHFLLGLLAADLKRLKVPVTHGTMTYHMVNIPNVFDRAFPGYRESGLTSLVRPKVSK